MLQEIIRSPELLKALTGSSLKGPMDPIYDKMSEEDKKKLAHFDLLQRKGFDVEELKKKMLEAHKKKEEDTDF